MSLQDIAAKGRYGDTMLIHVSPEELGGLHALAKANGAKHGLTLNPETGLYEAFSLKKLLKKALPTILGVAASFIPGVGPLVAAGIGALAGAATAPKGQSLFGAISGGLGGWGGFGIANALSNAGSAAVGNAAANAAYYAGEEASMGAAREAALAGLSKTDLLMAGLNTVNPVTQGAAGAWEGAKSLVGNAATPATAETATSAAMPAVEATGLGGLGAAASTVMKAATPMMAEDVPTEAEQQAAAAAQEAEARKKAGLDIKMPKYRVESDGKGGTMFVKEDTGETSGGATGVQPEGGLRDSGGAFAWLQGESPQVTPIKPFAEGILGKLKDKTAEQKLVTAANTKALQENSMFAPIGSQGLAGLFRGAKGGTVHFEAGDWIRPPPEPTPAPAPAPIDMWNTASNNDSGYYDPTPAPAPPPALDAEGGYWITNPNGSPRYVPAGTAPPSYAAEYNPGVSIPTAPIAAPAPPAADAKAAFKMPKYSAARDAGGIPQLTNTETGVTDAASVRAPSVKGKRTSQQALDYMLGRGAAAGGTVELQSGGFVIPADVVSAIGAGSSGAGLEVLAKKFGARPVQGKGHGQSDDVEASIDGRQRARVARDEAILDAQQVARIGGGDPKKGAKKLYDMMARVRKQATGSPKQMRVIDHAKALA